jgi:transposase
MSLYAKRLERGRFIWPSPADGTVALGEDTLPSGTEGFLLEVALGELLD